MPSFWSTRGSGGPRDFWGNKILTAKDVADEIFERLKPPPPPHIELDCNKKNTPNWMKSSKKI